MNNKYIFIFIVICSILTWYVFHLTSEMRKENAADYDFVITEISQSYSGTYTLKSKDTTYQFWNFLVSRRDDIKVGDRLIKRPGADQIRIYRKDSTDVEQLVEVIR